MKKSLAIFAASIAALTQTAFAQADNTASQQASATPAQIESVTDDAYNHNSLFLQASVGYVNNYVEGNMTPAYKKNANAESNAASFGFDVGLNIKRRADVYVGMDYAIGGGNAYIDSDRGEEDIDYTNFNIHVGAQVFPFSRTSALKNAFVGLEFGLDWYYVEVPDRYYLNDERRLDYSLKLGNVWSVTRHIDLGAELHVDYHNYPVDNTDFFLRGSLRDMKGYSVGINFIAMRR